MKTFFFFVVTMLAAVGIFAGLLYTHVVPADPLAQSSQLAATALEGLGLYSPSQDGQPSMATATPAGQHSAFGALQQQLSQEKARLDAERAALGGNSSAATPPPGQGSADFGRRRGEGPFAPRLAGIYNTMSAEDLDRIFSKQPNREVARALAAMDPQKAGSVLATMPVGRAAKIAVILSKPGPIATSANRIQ